MIMDALPLGSCTSSSTRDVSDTGVDPRDMIRVTYVGRSVRSWSSDAVTLNCVRDFWNRLSVPSEAHLRSRVSNVTRPGTAERPRRYVALPFTSNVYQPGGE